MNFDFVPFKRGVRVLCKPRLIFSHINGPNIGRNLDCKGSITSHNPVKVLIWEKGEKSGRREKRPKKLGMSEKKNGEIRYLRTCSSPLFQRS